jgi:hypothetical protein
MPILNTKKMERLEGNVLPVEGRLILGVQNPGDELISAGVLYRPDTGSVLLPWHFEDRGQIGRLHAVIEPISDESVEYVPFYQPEGLELNGKQIRRVRTIRHPFKGEGRKTNVSLRKGEAFEMVTGKNRASIVHIGKTFHLELLRVGN